MTWGDMAWVIPLMEQCQLNIKAYTKSEMLLTAARIAPIESRGDLLAAASEVCPFNMQV